MPSTIEAWECTQCNQYNPSWLTVCMYCDISEESVLADIETLLVRFVERKEAGQSQDRNTYHDFKLMLDKLKQLKSKKK